MNALEAYILAWAAELEPLIWFADLLEAVGIDWEPVVEP